MPSHSKNEGFNHMNTHEGKNNYIILDGLEGDARIYCQRC